MDVKQAFLQSEKLQREVFVIPLPEADLSPESVWKLRIAVYGLADASRQWFFTALKRIMVEQLSFSQVKLEHEIFYGLDCENQLEGIVLMHVVDELLYAGTGSFFRKVEKLKELEKIGSVQNGKVTSCGLTNPRRGPNLEGISREMGDIEPF